MANQDERGHERANATSASTRQDDWPGLYESARRASEAAQETVEQVRSCYEQSDYREASMTEPLSRYELEAKLETIETRMDARVASIEGKIDSFLAAQVERDKRVDADIGRLATSHAEIKAGISSLKATTIVTAITAVLAIVFGIAAFNAGLTSNMLAAFQAGKGETTPSSGRGALEPAGH